MNFSKKHLVASVALGAVALVWVPRFTGWDPLGLYATASPVDASAAAGGLAEWPDAMPGSADGMGMPGGAMPGAMPGSGSDGAGQLQVGASSPVNELGTVLAFLESRDRVGSGGADRRGTSGGSKAFGATGDGADADLPTTLDAFLAFHPLSAIAVGSKRSCALFGRTSVRPGDTLLDGLIVVHAIERDGVVLDTDTGRVKVPLPTPGQLRASARTIDERSSSEQN